MKQEILQLLLKQANKNLEDTDYHHIIQWVRENKQLQSNQPVPYARIDPRSGIRILYSMVRFQRPRDFAFEKKEKQKTCPICEGKTTKIWDIAPLSRGYTFINENLYPTVYPFSGEGESEFWPGLTDPTCRNSSPAREQENCQKEFRSFGMHFLQWLSTEHERELHNMDVSDIRICLERLAVFEKFLLTQKSPMLPRQNGFRGHVTIFKNFGRGASLEHGHVQILHSTILAPAIEQDIRFLQTYREGFSHWLLSRTEETLRMRSYAEKKVILLTPFCIKRPLECILCVSDTSKNHIHQLSREELFGIAEALHEIATALCKLMPQVLAKPPSYSLVFHSDEIGGFYIEILPYSQEIAGCEYAGIYTCEGTPEQSADMYRQVLSEPRFQ